MVAALILLAAVSVSPAGAAALGIVTPLVSVGPGVSENSQRQVVRTADGVVYIAAVDDDGYGQGPDAWLHMYRARTIGIPTGFAVADASHEPQVTGPLDLSGGDARLDAEGTINLTYVVANASADDVGGYRGTSLTVKYQTFDTSSDQWGPAQTVTTLSSDGDGVRGKVVSALALDPSGEPLIVTASSDGVSAWSRGTDGAWSGTALAGEYGLHPSLAFDASDRAHVAWLSSPYGTASVRYASRAPEGGWSQAEVVADDDVLSNQTSDQGPSLAFDGAAHPVVLWLGAKDDVRLGVRGRDGLWTRNDPPPTFAHSPGLYLRGDDRLVFLGHDADTHPAYLSYDAAMPDWSSVTVFPAPAEERGYYAYDGSASARFDPLFDTDCTTVDVAFFSEYSAQPGRIGKPDLYYAAVTLPESPGGCARAQDPGGSDENPAPDPDPGQAPVPGPPVVLLGDERVQPQVDANGSGVAEAFETVASATGAVRSISVYVDESSTGERVTVGIYADGDGHPGALLTQAAARARAGEWNAISIPEAAVTSGERYWLAILGTGDGQIAFRDAPQGGCRSETTPSSITLDALPSTWITGVEWDDCPLAARGLAG